MINQQQITKNIQQLIKYLKITYSSRLNSQIQQAQVYIKSFTNNILEFYEYIYQIMLLPIDNQIKDAAILTLKGNTYDVSKKMPQFAPKMVQRLYQMIVRPNHLTHKQRSMISTAIQYLFNQDNLGLFKDNFLKTFLDNLVTAIDLDSIDGILLSLFAYANSLVQIKDKQNFTIKSFLPLKNIALKLYLQLYDRKQDIQCANLKKENNPNYGLVKSSLTAADTLFQLLEITLQRLDDQRQDCQQTLKFIQNDQQLRNIISAYLVIGIKETIKQRSIFARNTSFDAQCNLLKQKILEIIYNLYESTNTQVLFLCYNTFSNQTGRIFQPKKHQSRIMILIMQILQKHAELNMHYQFFSFLSIDIFLKLLIYSKTLVQQAQLMEQDPKQFVQLTQQYCQNLTSSIVKVQAGRFLLVLIQRIDGMINNIFHILLLIIKSAYNNELNLAAIIQLQDKQYEIFNASSSVKLDTCLMCLALIFPKISKKQQLLKQYAYFMIQNYNNFWGQVNDIVLLRLINLIGFSNNFNYLQMIQNKIRNNELFRIQGLNSLNRFLRIKMNQKQQQRFVNILKNIIDLIKPTDQIFENLLLKNYELILYSDKISKQFIKLLLSELQKQINYNKYKNNNTHNVYMLFNLFTGLIQKQNDLQIIQQYQNQFFKISINSYFFQYYDHQKILQLAHLFLTKKNIINSNHIKFTAFTLTKIHQYYKSKYLYYYYNQIIQLHTSYSQISPLYSILYKMLFQSTLDQQVITKHITILIGQIILKFPSNQSLPIVIQGILQRLNLQYTGKQGNQITKGRLCGIILTSFYANKNQTYNILVRLNAYQNFLRYVIQHPYYFRQDIDKKIYFFGLTILLQIQLQNRRYIKQVLIGILNMLNIQFNSRRVREQKTIIKMQKDQRRFLRYNNNKKELQQQIDEKNEYLEENITQISQSINNKKYNHIFYKQNEYEYFQIKIWPIIKTSCKIEFTKQQLAMLKKILRIKQIQGKLRQCIQLKK